MFNNFIIFSLFFLSLSFFNLSHMSDWWNRPFKKSRATYSDYTPPARPQPNPRSLKRYTTFEGTLKVKWWLTQKGDGYIIRQRMETAMAEFNNGNSLYQRNQARNYSVYEDGPVYWMGNRYEPITVHIHHVARDAILFTISFTQRKTKAEALRIILAQINDFCTPLKPAGLLQLAPQFHPPTPSAVPSRRSSKPFRRF